MSAAPGAAPAVAPPPDAALDALIFKHSGANKRSIPEAIFVDNVEGMCKDRLVPNVVARLQELYGKYQYMQSSLVAQRSSLKTKLPDISQALETVNHLKEKRDKGAEGEEAEYTYQLSENIFAKAVVPPTNVVCLWLGANCMLEYTLDEATELLKTNEANAKETLKSVEEDTAFLRDQVTTTEVNIARVHNYGVKVRQKLLADEAAAAADGTATASDAGQAPTPAKPAASFAPAARTEDPRFAWKQDADEVEVSVIVPDGAQKADIKVTILAESLKVEHKGKVVLDGRLAGKCSPNGSTWTMNKGRVEITLEKSDSTPWKSFLETE